MGTEAQLTQIDAGLRRRSSHSISGFAVTASGKWAYENSWGTDWGDLGKSVGYDSRFYSGFAYQPVLRDEVPVLMARELPPAQVRVMSVESPMETASKEFHRKIAEIKTKMSVKGTIQK